MWPDSTWSTINIADDEATSPHLQDIITIPKVATTKDSKSDSTQQTSTNNGSNMTQETRNNNITAIVLSIIFTLVLTLIIVLVVMLIIVKLSRYKHRSGSDWSQVPLVDSDGPQEVDIKLNVHASSVYECNSLVQIFFQDAATSMCTLDLDKVLDSDGKSERHLGEIADAMTDWKGEIAEILNLSLADVNNIETANKDRLDLQKYVKACRTMNVLD